MLKTFHDCVGLPIQVIDDSGNILEIQGSIAPFCSRLNPYLPADDTCAMLHAKAAKQAMALGETYIFSCHASLNHIVFPLIHKNALLGAILAGPFLMDDPDSLLISDVGRRYTIPSEDLLELYDDTHSLPVVPPAKVTQISSSSSQTRKSSTSSPASTKRSSATRFLLMSQRRNIPMRQKRN